MYTHSLSPLFCMHVCTSAVIHLLYFTYLFQLPLQSLQGSHLAPPIIRQGQHHWATITH
jgi:hypothetical protein